jgi:branched-chain amino acid transport system substrate-binding protein
MKRDRATRPGIVLMAGLMLTAAGCGSSSGSATTGGVAATTAAPASTTAALTGDPVKIMMILSVTGQFAPDPAGVAGAQAAAAAINAAGGIKGHPVQIEPCDEADSPDKSAACGRQAVADKVVAVYAVSNFEDKWRPAVEAAGIPMVGGEANSTGTNQSKLYFPLATGNLGLVVSDGTTCGLAGSKKPVAVVVDIAAAQFLAAFIDAGLAPFNLKTTAKIAIPPTATDLSSFAAQAVQSGADCVALALNNEIALRYIPALAQAGYTGTVAFATPAIGPGEASSGGSDLEGVYVPLPFAPTNDTSVPGIVQFLKEAGPDGAKGTARMVQPWATVHVIANALSSASLLDGPSLATALANAGPLSFSPLPTVNFSKPPVDKIAPGLRIFSNSVVVYQIKSGQLQGAFGGKPVDVTAPKS